MTRAAARNAARLTMTNSNYLTGLQSRQRFRAMLANDQIVAALEALREIVCENGCAPDPTHSRYEAYGLISRLVSILLSKVRELQADCRAFDLLLTNLDAPASDLAWSIRNIFLEIGAISLVAALEAETVYNDLLMREEENSPNAKNPEVSQNA